MNKWLLLILLFCVQQIFAQQRVIPLYNGQAPGSENWNWDEGESTTNMFNTKIIYNVTKPSLSVFLPDSASATGSAVIIFPGGGFHVLSIESEGNEVARWLNKKGVAAFVLKYRLAHSLTNDPAKELMNKMGSNVKKFNEDVAPVIKLAVADANAAVNYVRSHASEFNIKPDAIGVMGFSAGGTLAAALAYHANEGSRPDFAAPIYAYLAPEVKTSVSADAPPVFIAAATDDQLGLASNSVEMYNDWLRAKRSSELHIYARGGHGFGMRKQNLTSDSWIDRFGDWLRQLGYMTGKNEPKWMAQMTNQQIEEMRRKQDEQFRNDWANMNRFKQQDSVLNALGNDNNEHRVVFMGNSITEGWGRMDSAFFAGRPYINRGISGQTTPQMLVRFPQDVISLHPKVVVILAGTNDIAGNTGPMTLQQTFDNLVAMAQLAKANNIKVILSSIMPVYDYPWKPGLQPANKIITLNTWLKEYAAKNNMIYLDYFTSLADSRNGMKAEYSEDGVHPNLAGYKVIEPLAEKAIAEALNNEGKGQVIKVKTKEKRKQ